MKLVTWATMAGIEFTIRAAPPLKSPTGKLPFITVDGGQPIAGSGPAIDHLTDRFQVTLDDGQSNEDLARAHAIRRMCEEHLYFVMVYSRWMEPENWVKARAEYFKPVPAPIRPLVAAMARRGVRQSLHGQGIGRHSRDQIYEFGSRDIGALAALLDNRDYVLGTEPRSVDASVYGVLATLIYPPIESPLKEAARAQANLVAYCDRMRDRFGVV